MRAITDMNTIVGTVASGCTRIPAHKIAKGLTFQYKLQNHNHKTHNT